MTREELGLNLEEHRVGRFSLIAGWPPEVLPVIQFLAEFDWLIPPWCHEVIVSWCPTQSDLASVSTEFTYRRAKLFIGGDFFSLTEYDKRKTITHELLHIHVAPIIRYVEKVMGDILDEGDAQNIAFAKTIKETLKEKHEGCVEDLALCLAARPDS